jgi:hypothetical protein
MLLLVPGDPGSANIRSNTVVDPAMPRTNSTSGQAALGKLKATLQPPTCASLISRWKRRLRLATGAPLLKLGRPLSAISDTVAMMGSATVRACTAQHQRNE